LAKVINLAECVNKIIKPNISLHFSFTHNRPMAFAWEIIRQNKDRNLDLKLVGTGMLEYAVALIWAGHVKKLEGAFFGETYPAPRPNRLIRQFAREGKLDIEYWTNLTIPQRFMAGAFGWEFIPTLSLKGSALLKDHLNSGKAFIVKEPISSNETIMLRSLQPDVTVVHGSLADEDGNTVITPPYGEDLWGVFAAKKTVVVVEKIVSKETIKSLSHLVKIPGHKVDYIVEASFSAHPYGTSPIGYGDLAYGEDYEFRKEFSKAIENEEEIDDWMHKWGLDISHEAYLEKLGEERIEYLKVIAKNPSVSKDIIQESIHEPPSPTEKLIISASRLIAKRIKEKGIETILAGIGVSHITAWLVHKRLQAEGVPIKLLTETGYYGYEPIEGDPYIFNFGNLYTNSKQSSFIEILGQFVADPLHPCMAILSGAQIDELGNINSTKIPEKNVYLTGSGGANDIASVAADVVAMMNGNSKKFVKQVPYVTSPGDKVSTIFTNVAVLTRENSEDGFTVSNWIPSEENGSLADYKNKLSQLLPWDFDIDAQAEIISEPTEQELKWVRAFDPQREFLQ
jgi:acyl CoA:acetate/3-ketoacid CoA transferase alpha subunit/acyl CoA:acetate/3-ketoacid CoA transferase beta subunit